MADKDRKIYEDSCRDRWRDQRDGATEEAEDEEGRAANSSSNTRPVQEDAVFVSSIVVCARVVLFFRKLSSGEHRLGFECRSSWLGSALPLNHPVILVSALR